MFLDLEKKKEGGIISSGGREMDRFSNARRVGWFFVCFFSVFFFVSSR
jgi:hypothetical protein